MNNIRRFLAAAFIPFVLTSCTNHEARQKSANVLATHAGFKSDVIKAGNFWLQTYQKVQNPRVPYTVYIEGDGFAFKNKWEISNDPTPIRSMLLNLATHDYRSNIIYIARPCQYQPALMDRYCNNSYWTTKRMSDEVVNSINVAIKQITHGQQVDIIGYSGGGGVAVLVAERNNQIRSIITIAGNLDHVAFNQYHKVRPMIGSLNPIDVATKVRHIPQMHYTGSDDKIVPAFIADKFVQTANSSCVKQEIVPGVSHNNGWENMWNYVLSTPVTCSTK
jgi:dienelactone hydrolase